jgi:hypothetical protein
MPTLSTLEHVADILIRRVLSEVTDAEALPDALRRIYPFGDDRQGRSVWAAALLRHGVRLDLEERITEDFMTQPLEQPIHSPESERSHDS